MQGRLPQLPGERATMADWANHLSTLFPEVRLKRYIEMRGGHVGPREHVSALPALFVGLLYDPGVLDEAVQLIKDWSAEDRQRLRDDAPRLGLATQIRGRDLQSVARDVLPLVKKGLARRARSDAKGRDETKYLAPLEAIAETGKPLASVLLDRYAGAWGGSVLPAFEECVF